MEQTKIGVDVPAPRAARKSAAVPPLKMTTAQLKEALRASLGADEDPTSISRTQGAPTILVEEVAAPGSNRRCDLLHIGLWASRGAGTITVFELKVDRGDWQRELKDPAKAEAWWPYCNEFWVVAAPGVVQPDELPPGWGLMEPPTGKTRSEKFRKIVKAEKRAAKLTPLLVASIVARADNMRRAQIGELNRRHGETVDKVRSAAAQRAARAQLPAEDRQRLDMMLSLEKLLGVRLEDFVWRNQDPFAEATPHEVAEAFRDYVRGDIELQRKREALEKAAEKLLPDLDRVREVCLPFAAEAALNRRKGR